MLSNIGEIIKSNRKKSKLTQKQLADLAGIGKTAVWDLENQAKNTRIDTLEKILFVLNIKVEFISPFNSAKEKPSDA